MKNPAPNDANVERLAFGRSGNADEIMLQQAATLAGLGYFSVCLQTNKVDACSNRHAAFFGLTPEQYIARASGMRGDLSMVHPEDKETLRQEYRNVGLGQPIQLEYRFLRPDGTWGVIAEHVSPEFDTAGDVIRAFGSSQDVTDVRRREAQALQSEHLETLGVLTAGVAHDFNNILAVVMGNAQLGQAHDSSVMMQEILAEIVDAAERGARLTRSLLSFAQRATLVPRDVHLNQAVLAAIRACARHDTTGVRFVTDLTDADPVMLMDPEQLQMVLGNILINAKEASAKDGEIVIRTQLLARSEISTELIDPSKDAEQFGVISIRDHGSGIPKEHLHRVTEPFFTTKNRAKGSGLGLSMAQGFARQCGGCLNISSDQAGTCVTLYFPKVISDRSSPANPEIAAGDLPARKVLLLEDEPAVSAVLVRQLESAGCEVMPVRTPAEANEALSVRKFDVAVFDNILRGEVSGVDVAKNWRARGVRLPIILLTGMPTCLSDQHLNCVDALLHKPAPLPALLKQIEICIQNAR